MQWDIPDRGQGIPGKYNPVYRGGPMHWADSEGLAKIVEGLKRQEQRMGSDFRFSKLLLDKAEKGEKFTR